MRIRFVLYCSVVALVTLACNPIYVSYDYDKDVDFQRFQSYSWMDIPKTEPQNAAEAARSSPLVAKRIRSNIDDQLVAKGLSRVDEGSDLLVVYHLGAKQMIEIQQNNYSGMSMWADSRVGGHAKVDHITEGMIIIDLLDAPSKQLVWRGIAENARKDDAPIDEIYKTIDRAITKVFEKYPPKG